MLHAAASVGQEKGVAGGPAGVHAAAGSSKQREQQASGSEVHAVAGAGDSHTRHHAPTSFLQPPN